MQSKYIKMHVKKKNWFIGSNILEFLCVCVCVPLCSIQTNCPIFNEKFQVASAYDTNEG